MSTYTIEGQPEEGWKLKFAMFANTYGDYFHAMGIPLLDGRTFTEQDKAGAPLVVMVNQSMAKHSWPGERAVGKRMHVGNPKKGLPWATVVGRRRAPATSWTSTILSSPFSKWISRRT